ncbi:MAG: hypothetical protein M0R46_10590 [Candidatus Muirbacterium halophilum]|nr:hypothetical protein [Candidatus Muirbacterium halophilum]
MRRSYISPEFNTYPTYGTYNIDEKSNFFGSCLLEIENNIIISNQNIIYHQKDTNEQIDLSNESSLEPIIYSAEEDMLSNHIISIDKTQSTYQKESNTKWNIQIDLKNILSNYIFSQMKYNRSFEGLTNNLIVNNDVNSTLSKYINNNIINKYKYYSIEFYIKYNDLSNTHNLKYKPNWNLNIVNNDNRMTKIESELLMNNYSLNLTFSQEKSSESYNFDYYFNILFNKI